ncbi:MAG: prepilin peptidase [Archangium sp.]
MEALFVIWVGVMGLCFGSFINVVIGRLPGEPPKPGDPPPPPEPDFGDSWAAFWRNEFKLAWESLKRLSYPPSRCPKCGHQIRWYENVPVVSWLALRGKCSACKEPISPRYILVELLVGVLFVVAHVRFGFTLELASAATFIVFLVPLIFIDAEHWILPFELTVPGLIAALSFSFALGTFRVSVIGAVGAFIGFRLMEFFGWLGTSFVHTNKKGITRRVGREAMGAADKYLLAMIGAQLGWRPLLGVVLFSSLQGAVYGIFNRLFTGTAGPADKDGKETRGEAPIKRWWRTPKIKGRSKLGLLWRRRQAMKRLEYWGSDEVDETLYLPFTPGFLRPNLPVWKRIAWVPVAIFLQSIPDEPPPDEKTGQTPEWVPQDNNLPFGPWLGLAALQVLLFSPWLVARLSHTPLSLAAELVLGG